MQLSIKDAKVLKKSHQNLKKDTKIKKNVKIK